ncbi:hypothetical protein HDU76_011286 [Blyttiomyces sp. JEL0837]|nr:hypothetical protein HDU76_011286 [Blyttiomyces sp. JEL0837]
MESVGDSEAESEVKSDTTLERYQFISNISGEFDFQEHEEDLDYPSHATKNNALRNFIALILLDPNVSERHVKPVAEFSQFSEISSVMKTTHPSSHALRMSSTFKTI